MLFASHPEVKKILQNNPTETVNFELTEAKIRAVEIFMRADTYCRDNSDIILSFRKLQQKAKDRSKFYQAETARVLQSEISSLLATSQIDCYSDVVRIYQQKIDKIIYDVAQELEVSFLEACKIMQEDKFYEEGMGELLRPLSTLGSIAQAYSDEMCAIGEEMKQCLSKLENCS